MGGITQIEHDSNRGVPSVAEHVSLPGEQVPQRRPSEAGVVNAVEVKLSDRVAEVELLSKIIVLGDVLSPLYSDIMLHAIHFVLQVVPKMLARRYPRKIITTKLHAWKISLLLQEG